MDVRAESPSLSVGVESTTETEASFDQIPGGRYHLVERLSAGAIGAVYKALDTVLDRPVAVKSIRLDTPFADHSPDELRERFVREARIAARLQHPNIVTIHDIVATPTRGYIIMEFIEGHALESLVASEKRLPLSAGIRIVTQLARALDYAHGRDVVHRDVKPTNILVSPDMNVWVTDFGIAKSELSTNLTMAGGVLGTPDYMSPEQAKGEDVDARSDLFSLGCILFECVVGEKPFRSPSLTGVLLSIINDEPVFPLNWGSLGLPVELKPILHHALEKDRKERYGSGAELIAALESLPEAAVQRADAIAQGEPSEETTAASEAKEDVSRAAESEASESVAEDEEPEPGPVKGDDVEAASPSAAAPSHSENIAGRAPEGPEAPKPGHEAPSDPEAAEASKAPAAAEKAESPAEKEPAPSDEQVSRAKGEPERDEEPEAGATSVSLEQMQALKSESQVLHLSPTLSAELQGVEITPEEGFLLSRIDGASRPNDIMSMSPMPEADTARALLMLLEKGLIKLGGVTRAAAVPAPEPSAPRPQVNSAEPPEAATSERDEDEKDGVDAATRAEVERLLGLAAQSDHPRLLGVSPDAPQSVRKSAFLELIAKYHPDRYPNVDEAFRGKLGSLCASASEAMTEFKVPPKPSSTEGESAQSTEGSNGGTNGDGINKVHFARELYGRALTSFERADYWDAIQLLRQAIDADAQEAAYYALLGRALLQNRKWRKEAADNFLKATELEPQNVEYLGMLGAIYQREGLASRASSLLKRARALKPDYELPELDAEREVTTG